MADYEAVGDVVIDPSASSIGQALIVNGRPFPFYITDDGITINVRDQGFTSIRIELIVTGTITVKPI